MRDNTKDEQVKISFLGMKLECSNPTSKTIIIIVIAMVFFMLVLLFIPELTACKAVMKWLSG